MKKIKGSCLCKSISFEIINECRYSVLCHCTMCQKSNAEFSNYTKVQKNNFKFLSKKNLKWFFSSKNFNVLSIDLPGHGNSDGPCLDSIEKITDWLEKVFEKLNLKNLIIIAHSQGCLEALEYSFKYKKRLKKMV